MMQLRLMTSATAIFLPRTKSPAGTAWPLLGIGRNWTE